MFLENSKLLFLLLLKVFRQTKYNLKISISHKFFAMSEILEMLVNRRSQLFPRHSIPSSVLSYGSHKKKCFTFNYSFYFTILIGPFLTFFTKQMLIIDKMFYCICRNLKDNIHLSKKIIQSECNFLRSFFKPSSKPFPCFLSLWA